MKSINTTLFLIIFSSTLNKIQGSNFISFSEKKISVEKHFDDKTRKVTLFSKNQRLIGDSEIPGRVLVLGDTSEYVTGIHIFNSFGHEIACFPNTELVPQSMIHLDLISLPKGKYEMILSGLKHNTSLKFYVNHSHRIVQLKH